MELGYDLGYDSILRLCLPIGCAILCYADDTLIVASAESFEEARVRAELEATFLIRSIQRLGLKVSILKTEAVAFTADRIPEGAVIRIRGEVVSIGSTVKYLGLILDSRDFPRSLSPAHAQSLGHSNVSGSHYRQYWRPWRAAKTDVRT